MTGDFGTYIWNQKRKIWSKGPVFFEDLVTEKMDLYITVLNGTTIMIIGGHMMMFENKVRYDRIFVGNLQSNSWVQYPSLPGYPGFLGPGRGAVTSFDKMGQR